MFNQNIVSLFASDEYFKDNEDDEDDLDKLHGNDIIVKFQSFY